MLKPATAGEWGGRLVAPESGVGTVAGAWRRVAAGVHVDADDGCEGYLVNKTSEQRKKQIVPN